MPCFLRKDTGARGGGPKVLHRLVHHGSCRVMGRGGRQSRAWTPSRGALRSSLRGNRRRPGLPDWCSSSPPSHSTGQSCQPQPGAVQHGGGNADMNAGEGNGGMSVERVWSLPSLSRVPRVGRALQHRALQEGWGTQPHSPHSAPRAQAPPASPPKNTANFVIINTASGLTNSGRTKGKQETRSSGHVQRPPR